MSELKLAERVIDLSIETAFEVLSKAKQLERKGIKVVHFEIGEPDFDTPNHIKEAAIKALKEGFTHYTPSPGIIELREALADKILEDRGVKLNPENQIIVAPGAKPNLMYCIFSLVNPGERVLLPDPSFPPYWPIIELAGGIPVSIPLREEREFTMDPEDVRREAEKGAKLLLLSFPNNPCGSNISKKDVKELAEIAQKHNLWVLSDEVYSKFVYDGEHVSIYNEPGMEDRTIVVDGFSKTYAMTGWRLGYAFGPKEVIEKMIKLQINFASCSVAFVQKAAIAALTGPQECVKEMLNEYNKRRKAVVDGLNSIKGFKCIMPKGAFYAFPNVKGTGVSSKELAQRLLDEAHVATLNGKDFGGQGEGFIRLSYATSLENIKEGISRIKEFVEERLKV